MAKGMTEKLNKHLTFMVGAKDPSIASLLGLRGLKGDALNEGWQLFEAAAGVKLPARAGQQTGSGTEATVALAELDRWENDWFPVADATLKRHHPDVHALVFDNLRQADGREVIVSVGTLLHRLAAIREKPKGEEAIALLESRGLTPAVLKSAENLLALLKSQGDITAGSSSAASAEEQEKALAAAWAWYQEWSAIARTVITRGDHLARLGLRKQKRAKAADEKVEQAKPK